MSCILLKRTGHLNLNNVPLLAWRIPWKEEPVGYSPWGHKELDMTERLTLSFPHIPTYRPCQGHCCVTSIPLLFQTSAPCY